MERGVHRETKDQRDPVSMKNLVVIAQVDRQCHFARLTGFVNKIGNKMGYGPCPCAGAAFKHAHKGAHLLAVGQEPPSGGIVQGRQHAVQES